MGYKTELTKGSGDQGADLILQKNHVKIVIQIKRYSGKVGNKAVQEVIAAKYFYKADKGIVITNNYFTNSAIDLALSSHIKLINRDKLIKMIHGEMDYI